MSMHSSLLYSPAAERNHSFIVQVVKRYYQHVIQQHTLDQQTQTDQHAQANQHTQAPLRLLEIASGSGQHSSYLAQALPQLMIQPSDQDLAHVHSIRAYKQQLISQGIACDHLQDAIQLDVTQAIEQWPLSEMEFILCVNMIHISPWHCTQALLEAAGHTLTPSGFLITYGPYKFPSQPLAVSNQSFDQSLKSRNPQWGIRSVHDIDHYATQQGLTRVETIPCPANNHILVYGRT